MNVFARDALAAEVSEACSMDESEVAKDDPKPQSVSAARHLANQVPFND